MIVIAFLLLFHVGVLTVAGFSSTHDLLHSYSFEFYHQIVISNLDFPSADHDGFAFFSLTPWGLLSQNIEEVSVSYDGSSKIVTPTTVHLGLYRIPISGAKSNVSISLPLLSYVMTMPETDVSTGIVCVQDSSSTAPLCQFLGQLPRLLPYRVTVDNTAEVTQLIVSTPFGLFNSTYPHTITFDPNPVFTIDVESSGCTVNAAGSVECPFHPLHTSEPLLARFPHEINYPLLSFTSSRAVDPITFPVITLSIPFARRNFLQELFDSVSEAAIVTAEPVDSSLFRLHPSDSGIAPILPIIPDFPSSDPGNIRTAPATIDYSGLVPPKIPLSITALIGVDANDVAANSTGDNSDNSDNDNNDGVTPQQQSIQTSNALLEASADASVASITLPPASVSPAFVHTLVLPQRAIVDTTATALSTTATLSSTTATPASVGRPSTSVPLMTSTAAEEEITLIPRLLFRAGDQGFRRQDSVRVVFADADALEEGDEVFSPAAACSVRTAEQAIVCVVAQDIAGNPADETYSSFPIYSPLFARKDTLDVTVEHYSSSPSLLTSSSVSLPSRFSTFNSLKTVIEPFPVVTDPETQQSFRYPYQYAEASTEPIILSAVMENQLVRVEVGCLMEIPGTNAVTTSQLIVNDFACTRIAHRIFHCPMGYSVQDAAERAAVTFKASGFTVHDDIVHRKSPTFFSRVLQEYTEVKIERSAMLMHNNAVFELSSQNTTITVTSRTVDINLELVATEAMKKLIFVDVDRMIFNVTDPLFEEAVYNAAASYGRFTPWVNKTITTTTRDENDNLVTRTEVVWVRDATQSVDMECEGLSFYTLVCVFLGDTVATTRGDMTISTARSRNMPALSPMMHLDMHVFSATSMNDCGGDIPVPKAHEILVAAHNTPNYIPEALPARYDDNNTYNSHAASSYVAGADVDASLSTASSISAHGNGVSQPKLTRKSDPVAIAAARRSIRELGQRQRQRYAEMRTMAAMEGLDTPRLYAPEPANIIPESWDHVSHLIIHYITYTYISDRDPSQITGKGDSIFGNTAETWLFSIVIVIGVAALALTAVVLYRYCQSTSADAAKTAVTAAKVTDSARSTRSVAKGQILPMEAHNSSDTMRGSGNSTILTVSSAWLPEDDTDPSRRNSGSGDGAGGSGIGLGGVDDAVVVEMCSFSVDLSQSDSSSNNAPNRVVNTTFVPTRTARETISESDAAPPMISRPAVRGSNQRANYNSRATQERKYASSRRGAFRDYDAESVLSLDPIPEYGSDVSIGDYALSHSASYTSSFPSLLSYAPALSSARESTFAAYIDVLFAHPPGTAGSSAPYSHWYSNPAHSILTQVHASSTVAADANSLPGNTLVNPNISLAASHSSEPLRFAREQLYASTTTAAAVAAAVVIPRSASVPAYASASTVSATDVAASSNAPSNAWYSGYPVLDLPPVAFLAPSVALSVADSTSSSVYHVSYTDSSASAAATPAPPPNTINSAHAVHAVHAVHAASHATDAASSLPSQDVHTHHLSPPSPERDSFLLGRDTADSALLHGSVPSSSRLASCRSSVCPVVDHHGIHIELNDDNAPHLQDHHELTSAHHTDNHVNALEYVQGAKEEGVYHPMGVSGEVEVRATAWTNTSPDDTHARNNPSSSVAGHQSAQSEWAAMDSNNDHVDYQAMTLRVLQEHQRLENMYSRSTLRASVRVARDMARQAHALTDTNTNIAHSVQNGAPASITVSAAQAVREDKGDGAGVPLSSPHLSTRRLAPPREPHASPSSEEHMFAFHSSRCGSTSVDSTDHDDHHPPFHHTSSATATSDTGSSAEASPIYVRTHRPYHHFPAAPPLAHGDAIDAAEVNSIDSEHNMMYASNAPQFFYDDGDDNHPIHVSSGSLSSPQPLPEHSTPEDEFAQHQDPDEIMPDTALTTSLYNCRRACNDTGMYMPSAMDNHAPVPVPSEFSPQFLPPPSHPLAQHQHPAYLPAPPPLPSLVSVHDFIHPAFLPPYIHIDAVRQAEQPPMLYPPSPYLPQWMEYTPGVPNRLLIVQNTAVRAKANFPGFKNRKIAPAPRPVASAFDVVPRRPLEATISTDPDAAVQAEDYANIIVAPDLIPDWGTGIPATALSMASKSISRGGVSVSYAPSMTPSSDNSLRNDMRAVITSTDDTSPTPYSFTPLSQPSAYVLPTQAYAYAQRQDTIPFPAAPVPQPTQPYPLYQQEQAFYAQWLGIYPQQLFELPALPDKDGYALDCLSEQSYLSMVSVATTNATRSSTGTMSRRGYYVSNAIDLALPGDYGQVQPLHPHAYPPMHPGAPMQAPMSAVECDVPPTMHGDDFSDRMSTYTNATADSSCTNSTTTTTATRATHFTAASAISNVSTTSTMVRRRYVLHTRAPTLPLQAAIMGLDVSQLDL